MSTPRTTKRMILAECDPIRKFMRMSDSILQMTDHVRRMVASPENRHIRCVTPAKTGVVVWTDSGAWASRLRFAVPALTGRLPKVNGFDASGPVTVRVLPDESAPVAAPSRAELSMSSAETIWACAAHIEDEKLAAALRRIASHASE